MYVLTELKFTLLTLTSLLKKLAGTCSSSKSKSRSRGSVGRRLWRRRLAFLARWVGFGRPGHGISGSSSWFTMADAGLNNSTSASFHTRDTIFAANSAPTCPLWLCCCPPGMNWPLRSITVALHGLI